MFFRTKGPMFLPADVMTLRRKASGFKWYMLGSLLTKNRTLETLRKSVKTDNVSRGSFRFFSYNSFNSPYSWSTKLFVPFVIFDVYGIIPDLLAVSEFC